MPRFPDPTPLEFDEEEREDILKHLMSLYDGQIENRERFKTDHIAYDAMYRGDVGHREGPWPGSADLHIPMPYWLVDSVSVRLDSTIWGQTPLVGGEAEEDDDQEIFRNASMLVDWHLQNKRMNARSLWSRLSKLRCIHGYSVGLISYVRDEFTYRDYEAQQPSFQFELDGTLSLDEEGQPIEPTPKDTKIVRKTRYHGPVLEIKDWDDVLVPENAGINLQPRTPANPNGTTWAMLRSYEDLNLMWSKIGSTYTYLEDSKYETRDKWVDAQPSQDRTDGGSGNQASSLQHDRYEGRERNARGIHRTGVNANPEFEVVVAFQSWLLENEKGVEEPTECVFFFSRRPQVLLGGFRLSDIHWTGERPLLELQYQPVSNRWLSMGICEIAKHLSAELDTIHNMRMDVGFATNMPFFFFRATSAIDPEQIELRPLKGVPVDDINDVRFPQMGNVTTFYEKEEQILYTLVERVLGVTDLFLGMNPTRGAAARHATGFVGTQQEALARTSNIVAQDADAFSFFCRTLYNMEMQFGPDYRVLRLQGKEGPLTEKLSRDQLWLRGQFDFRLGSNQGTYSSMMLQEQAQALEQMAQWHPLISQDMGRLWEVGHFALSSRNIPSPERFLGPKSAVGPGVAKDQNEENGEMDQMAHGVGQPAPVHPNDNDDHHAQEGLQHMQSTAFQAMGSPNIEGHMAHFQQHQQAKVQKQQMAMQQQQQAAQESAQGQQQPGPGGQDRMVPQLMNVDQTGNMGQLPQQEGGNGQVSSPNIGAV